MRIIGHRGAAGLELENTLASLQRAKDLGVDGVEFDVRLTADRQLVLCHDGDLSRTATKSAKIEEMNLAELKQIPLKNGEPIPTLDEALDCLGQTLAVVEMKVSGCADELLAVLDKHPNTPVIIATFLHEFAAELEVKRHGLTVFLAEYTRPTEIIHFVRTAKADGIDLNAWVLNPLTYWLAKRRGLDIMVYTVNRRFIGWFIKKLYPDVAICTNHPERFVKSGKATNSASTRR